MLDLVKYDWQNGNGAWIRSHEWALVLDDTDDESGTVRMPDGKLRTKASLYQYLSNGKGEMLAFEIIERLPLPEDIRRTGRASLFLAMVVMYDDGRNLTGEQVIEAMRQRMSRP